MEREKDAEFAFLGQLTPLVQTNLAAIPGRPFHHEIRVAGSAVLYRGVVGSQSDNTGMVIWESPTDGVLFARGSNYLGYAGDHIASHTGAFADGNRVVHITRFEGTNYLAIAITTHLTR